MSDSDTDSNNEEIKIENVEKNESSESSEEGDGGNEKGQFDENKMASASPKPRRKRFIPKYEVDGVYKVILGEETQTQIEMLVGTHVNAQYPWKVASKDKIMESIEAGGELSEFFSIREQIQSYPEEEMLMGYIVDESNNVDEFYVCCTIEARDHCKQQSDRFIRRQEKKLEKAVQKKPRPWKSLGSEKEMLELIPINTRTLIEMEVKVKFPKEYEPKKFLVRDTNCVRDGFIELTPYRQKFNNVFKRRIDCECQASPPMTHNFAQTYLRYPQNVWTQSIADALGAFEDKEAGGDTGSTKEQWNIGGEKQDLENSGDEDEEEETIEDTQDEVGLQAFRTALNRMRRPSYIRKFNNFMTVKKSEMESIVELNTVMDMYFNDYHNLVATKSVDIFDSMTFEEYVCFTDVRAKDKYISCAVFHPMWSGIVAICYADESPVVKKTSIFRPDPIQRAVYGLNPVMIWSHTDSLFPKLYLECPREVKVLSFCPFNENILIGGCINGQIVVWDLTNKLENVEKIEVLSEKREKYRIAMNAHMGWYKNIQDKAVVKSTALSNLITSHYGPVSAINWLSPNFCITPTGKTEMTPKNKKSIIFLTGAEDGEILIWNLSVESVSQFESKKVKKSKRVIRRPSGLLIDISPLNILDRNLQPCYKILLGNAGQPQVIPLQSFGMNQPIIKYDYSPRNSGLGRKYYTPVIMQQTEEEINSTLYCGSSHGELVKISWEGHEFNTGELVNSEYCDIKFSCFIHDGIITCTQKNPFLDDITLTVGGKIFAIWHEKLLGRPLIWKKRSCHLTDGKWSLYKPSLLFITTSDGDLEIWDLLLRSDKPVAVQTLSGDMLTGVSLHTLPIAKNIIGVSDIHASFRMFLNPPIFMIENSSYVNRMKNMLSRELTVVQTFKVWQEQWMLNNPEILLELKRKEGELLALKEEEKKREKEEKERKLEEEAEAKRLAKAKVIGPEERWQMIIQKLIERTIAVKKRINRAELIEHEKPLRELEAQRLEKERRMLEIMKNQKAIFNDTVAILFPEAIKKELKPKKSFLPGSRESMKQIFMNEYNTIKKSAIKTVKENPFQVAFSWDATLADGKERRIALNAHEEFIKMHKCRIEEEYYGVQGHKLESEESIAPVEPASE